jgi:uncharacterized protein
MADDLKGACPFTIDRPVMRQRWERLTFLHWPFEPAVVQRLLPGGLRAETFGGAAWVGLVPFFMRVSSGSGLRLPWAGDFCETNVRTYVHDGRGRRGIWFFSLDAARLPAVITARAAFRLPYFWSRMRITTGGQAISYTCRRLGPGPRPASSRVQVSPGARFDAAELDERDHFLTARWVLFSVSGERRRFARAQHPPWPLHRATVQAVDDGLITAAGLPQPDGQPLVHYSPGVDVRIGSPEKY